MLERNSWELSLFSTLWLIGVSEISCKCPWQLCKQNLLLQPKSFELLSTAGGRQNTFCCHCLQHKLTMTHHPLHSSLGCRAGFIINSQGFLYALFQTIDKRSMLKFGEMKKKNVTATSQVKSWACVNQQGTADSSDAVSICPCWGCALKILMAINSKEIPRIYC